MQIGSSQQEKGQTNWSVGIAKCLDRPEILDRPEFLDRLELLDRLEFFDRLEFLDRLLCLERLECCEISIYQFWRVIGWVVGGWCIWIIASALVPF